MASLERSTRAASLIGLFVVVLSLAAWWIALNWAQPRPVADEADHLGVIQALARGAALPHERVSTPLTFHWIAAGAAQLVGAGLEAQRGLSALCAALGAGLLGWMARRREDGLDWAPALLFLWNPLFFAFSAQVYSEPLAMLTLAAAWGAFSRGQYRWAAAALFLACCVRQSNVIWLVAVAALAVLRDPLPRRSAARTARDVSPFALALAAFTALWWLAPGFAPRMTTANQLHFNPAQFLFFGVMSGLLWAPWLVETAWTRRKRLAAALTHAPVCAALLLGAGLLEMTFDNPHPANANPDYLRNRLLLALAGNAALRWAAGFLIVAAAAVFVDAVRDRVDRAVVALLWVLSGAFLALHPLVDPRYLIAPVFLIDMQMNVVGRTLGRLLAWRLALSAASATYVAFAAGPMAGL